MLARGNEGITIMLTRMYGSFSSTWLSYDLQDLIPIPGVCWGFLPTHLPLPWHLALPTLMKQREGEEEEEEEVNAVQRRRI
jgi:hypothetical protein